MVSDTVACSDTIMRNCIHARCQRVRLSSELVAVLPPVEPMVMEAMTPWLWRWVG